MLLGNLVGHRIKLPLPVINLQSDDEHEKFGRNTMLLFRLAAGTGTPYHRQNLSLEPVCKNLGLVVPDDRAVHRPANARPKSDALGHDLDEFAGWDEHLDLRHQSHQPNRSPVHECNRDQFIFRSDHPD